MSLILVVDDQTRAHVARALSDHVRRCKVNGWQVPPAVLHLAATFAASGGQARPIDATPELPADGGPAALTYGEAAHVLGISSRTVRRLATAGSLPVVNIAGCKRITRAALDAYLRKQGEAHDQPPA